MVPSDELCTDMEAVKAANPLSMITAETLAADFASPTMDLGSWKRLRCNRPTRSVQTAITDREWDDAQVDDEIPAGAEIAIGLDVAYKWDTTAAVALWKGPEYRLLGKPFVLTPPRDGSSLHPDEIKNALLELTADFSPSAVIMDMHRAEDVAAWIADDLALEVIDGEQTRMKAHVNQFEAFMDGLRNGTLRHTGDPELRRHVLNAIARRLPGGDHRFDRPSTNRKAVGYQDRRVIDALSAAAMVVEYSNRQESPRTSVYEDRELISA
jgi:phage terminase large subunit-like protein